MDRAHELTEKELNKLERRIVREYKTAVYDMQVKLRKYLEKTEAQRQVQEKLLNAGKITKEEYKNWCYRHNMVGKRWTDMLDTLTHDMHNANKIALKMTKETMPDVYALNHNFGVYQIEHDGQINTGLTLYNHDTAEYLLGDQRQLMPRPSTKKAAEIATNKDMQWNMRKIQSAVLQGVIQGESPYAVADRLRSVGLMNENASIRYARTMTTSAQNAGRYEAFRRATKLGVDLTIEWQATLDGRTRHEHRMMHGQRTDVDKPFHTPDGYTIYYPADCTGESNAPQHEIWNCRCTLLSWVKGFEGDTVKGSPKMGDMSFEEWQNEKAPKLKEVQKQKSFAESLIDRTVDPANFDFAFYENGDRYWTGWYEDGGQKTRIIEDTVGRLQQQYPMQATNGKEYNCTVDRVVVCDYDEAYRFLPDGKNDRRLDYDATAQVFQNIITVDGKEMKQAVLAVNRDYISTEQTLQKAIEQREKRIADGEIISAIGGYTNPETTVIHEWGHIYSNHMDSAMIHDEQVAHDYWEWYKTLSKDEIRRGISDYATTNRGEFEAECFLEMQMPNPRPLAVKWWSFMKKAIDMGY